MLPRRLAPPCNKPFRWLASFALTSSLLVGCSAQALPQSPQSKTGITCRVSQNGIELRDSHFALPGDQALTSLAPLVESLSAQSAKANTHTLLLDASPKSSANTLLRVLLSAQEADYTLAYLAVSDGWLELALPDSSSIPPLSVADIFFSISAGRLTASRNLTDLGIQNSELNDVANQKLEIESVLKKNCSSTRPCTHAVLSTNPALSLQEIYPLASALTELRRGEGSLRLLLSDDAPANSKTTSREDSQLTRALIRKTINDSQTKMRHCRDKFFENASAGGTITIQFTVTGLGLVFDAEIVHEKSTVQDASIHGCVLNEFLKMRFPKPEAQSLTLEHTVRL